MKERNVNNSANNMKKIFLIALSIVFFTACGDDDNNGKGGGGDTPPPGVDTEWKGETQGSRFNPLIDEWKAVKKNGKPYDKELYYKFWEAKSWTIATYLLNGEPKYKHQDNYIINITQFKTVQDGKIFEYKLTVNKTEDKLEIFDGRDTFEFEVYMGDKWRWLGDWNDKNDRHYNVYKGNYNPVKGTWKMIRKDGLPVDESNIFYCRYDENFYEEESKNGIDFGLKRSYIINGLGIRTSSYESLPSMDYEYKVEGDLLTLKSIEKNSLKTEYVRVK